MANAAIKLYKQSDTDKRVGINVQGDSVVGYNLYVNGTANITDSLYTASLNTGDLVVTGSASFTNGVIISEALPVGSGGTGKKTWTQYGVLYASASTTLAQLGTGTSGYVLTSGGSGVAPSWTNATNSNTASTIVKRDSSGNFSAGTITANLTGIASKATAANITTTTNAIAIYSNTTGTFSTKATASGAAYATSANGALTFGTLPVAQGGTGQTSIANIKAGKDADGNTITSKYVTVDTNQTITGIKTIQNTSLSFKNTSCEGNCDINLSANGLQFEVYNTTSGEESDITYKLPYYDGTSIYEIMSTKPTEHLLFSASAAVGENGVFSQITTGVLREVEIYKYGNIAIIRLAITTPSSAVSAGSNIFKATLNTNFRPTWSFKGVTYYSSSILSCNWSSDGETTVRVIAAQVSANLNLEFTLTGVMNGDTGIVQASNFESQFMDILCGQSHEYNSQATSTETSAIIEDLTKIITINGRGLVFITGAITTDGTSNYGSTRCEIYRYQGSAYSVVASGGNRFGENTTAILAETASYAAYAISGEKFQIKAGSGKGGTKTFRIHVLTVGCTATIASPT